MIECTFEDGHVANPTLRHMGVTAVVLKNGKLLMIKRSPDSYREPNKWGTIGGFMEYNETFSQCIRREILEETGYQVGELTLLTLIDNPIRPGTDRQIINIVFFCEATEKVREPDDNESTEQKWFGLDDIPSRKQTAFDDYDSADLYRRYVKERFALPYYDNLHV